ncbi:MAG: hypothetical protein MMC33_009092, partial [Icmadophila ericetorum]|nr:hypothetical protein [Icmadophila ericetorum]
MDSATPETSARSGMSLSNVKMLDSPEHWLLWNQDMRDFLIFSGFNDLLTRHAIMPERGTSTLAAHQKLFRQDRAKAATAEVALTTLELNFRQQGAGVFTELCKRLYELSLADCKDVVEYSEKFRK